MQVIGKKIQLDIKEVKIGAIQSDSIEEHGTILAVGKDVDSQFEVGKTLYFKAWAVDVISEGDKKLYFITSDSDAVCGIE